MSEIIGNLLIVAGQVVTLFLLMAVGFILVKRKQLSAGSLAQMSHLLLFVVCPCVIINSLQAAEQDAGLLRDIGITFLITLTYYVISGIGAMFLFRRTPEDTAISLRFGVIYANVGFMGIPLIQAVLGDRAVIFTVVAVACLNLCQWTQGVILMGGRQEISPRKALLNPGVIGLAVGLLLFLSGLRLPSVLNTTVGFLADLNTPLAMVVIGGQMASANLLETFRRRELYAVSALRLVAIPLLMALVLLPFRLSPLVYCTAVILSGAPSAGTTSIFAQQFHRDAVSAAQLVSLSTLLSILTLPIVAVAAQMLAK